MSEYFGPEDIGWNHEIEGEGGGKVGIATFGLAVQVWSFNNANAGKPSTVRAAALAFCVDDQMIVEAVEAHAWMYLEGPPDDFTKLRIEHEGE